MASLEGTATSPAIDTLPYEVFVTCDVCFETYVDPQILSCLHTFCKCCVDKIKGSKTIDCPLCKQVTNNKEIKIDFKTASLVETYSDQKELKNILNGEKPLCPTQMCEACYKPENVVCCKCIDCEQLLCQMCESAHRENDSFKEHTVKSIAALAAAEKSALTALLKQINLKETALTERRITTFRTLSKLFEVENDAIRKISEAEALIIDEVKAHHDHLRQEVHNAKEASWRTVKELQKKLDYHIVGVKSKRWLLEDLMDENGYGSLTDISEIIRREISKDLALLEVPKESDVEDTLDPCITIGSGFDRDASTQIFIYQPPTVCMTTGSAKDKSVISSTNTDVYQFKKVASVPNNLQVWDIKIVDNQLICTSYNHIHMFTKDLTLIGSVPIGKPMHDVRASVKLTGGDIMVAGFSTGLNVYNANGNHIQRVSIGNFSSLHKKDGMIYAFEWKQFRLLIFKINGSIWEIHKSIPLQCNITNNSANDRLWLTKNYIYVSVFKSHCIKKFNYSGDLTRSYGKLIIVGKETTEGYLCNPYLCNVDGEGNMLVLDHKHKRFQMCTDNDKWSFLSIRDQKIGSNPLTAALDGEGNLWVSSHTLKNTYDHSKGGWKSSVISQLRWYSL